MMTTVQPAVTVRIGNKSLEKSHGGRSETAEVRRKTAAERLAEDKQKYVKSAKARQLHSTLESNSQLKTVHSANALSSRSGGGNDVMDETKREERKKLNRSNTDADLSSSRLYSSKSRTRSTLENAINSITMSSTRAKEERIETEDDRSRSPKEEKSEKFHSFLYNKAKEGLKSVTSSIGGNIVAVESPKTRKSRSADVKPSKYRSSSVGANVRRRASHRVAAQSFSNQISTDLSAISPRTRLKNVRDGLKKVKADENVSFSHVRHHSKAVAAEPKKNNVESAIQNSSAFLRLTKERLSDRKSSKPLSIIDNTVQASRKQSCDVKAERENKQSGIFLQKQAAYSSDLVATATTNHSLSALERLKPCSSENALHRTTNSCYPVIIPKKDSSTPNFSNASRFRKSRLHTSSDHKKTGSRASSNEDSSPRPGSGNGIEKALEKILLCREGEEDDQDTAYNSMSPDASVDCKTLLASSQPASDRTVGGDSRRRSKTPESSRSRTPTCDEGINFWAHDIDMKETNLCQSKLSRKSSLNSLSRPKTDLSTSTCNPVTKSDHIQPLKDHETDANPIINDNADTFLKPSANILTPMMRKEQAPDYTRNNKSHANEHINTLKSQNTSSSASGDMNKPFTALTAADLQPRSTTKSSAAFKPTLPFAKAQYRCNAKRHNNAPASPTMSPNKQLARMTPPHGSSSSTPYSSLKRASVSSHGSSLKRNRHSRSKSDVSVYQSELDRFFSNMGMNDPLISPLRTPHDTLFTTTPFGSESDFSFAGASAYVRDSFDESMDVDPATAGLANAPSVSIIEKNARVMKWLMTCKKSTANTSPHSTKRAPPRPPRRESLNHPTNETSPAEPPPIPPRLTSYQGLISTTKVSDV